MNDSNLFSLISKVTSDINDEISEKYIIEGEEPPQEYVYSFVTQMLNEYLMYYKRVNNKPKNFTLFSDIDGKKESSTNHILEEYYGHIHEYNKLTAESNPNIELFNPDSINDLEFDQIFGLVSNDKLTYVSGSIITIIKEIVENKLKYTNYQIIVVKD